MVRSNTCGSTTPVPAGTYDLTFSGAVNPDEVFLLFETQSITDLRIFEADGTEVVPDASGQITLFTDTDYTFASRILDGVGSPQPIDLDALPANMTMQLALTGSGTNDVRSMTINRVEDQGVVAYRPRADRPVSGNQPRVCWNPVTRKRPAVDCGSGSADRFDRDARDIGRGLQHLRGR